MECHYKIVNLTKRLRNSYEDHDRSQSYVNQTNYTRHQLSAKGIGVSVKVIPSSVKIIKGFKEFVFVFEKNSGDSLKST